jgi:cell wall-associated NlpC family hydrolase
VPVFGNHRKLLFLPVAATAAALTFTTFSAGPALAAPAHSVQATSASARRAVPTRLRAYNWAKTQYRKPYEYGGTGPSGYDCSGLVMEAYRHAGISLPRTTYEMLRSWHLVRVSRPVRGDLAFYGSGHVELYDVGHWTFGAHAAGQLIGWIKFGPWWEPTAYYRVR